jgi:hypothetical protein
MAAVCMHIWRYYSFPFAQTYAVDKEKALSKRQEFFWKALLFIRSDPSQLSRTSATEISIRDRRPTNHRPRCPCSSSFPM